LLTNSITNKTACASSPNLSTTPLDPFSLGPHTSVHEFERGYRFVYDLANMMAWDTPGRDMRMVSPNQLYIKSPEVVQLNIHYSFIGVPEAEKYRLYALSVAIWLKIKRLQTNTFSNQGAKQSVLHSDLDNNGFPKPTLTNEDKKDTVPNCHPKLKSELTDSLCTSLRRLELEGILYPLSPSQDECHTQQSGTSVGPVDDFGFPTHPTLPEDYSLDSIGDNIFGALHWRTARISSDLMDMPYSFMELLDLHIVLVYIECVIAGEAFNDLELSDARLIVSESRNAMQFHPDILQMLDRLQSVLEDINFLHFVSVIESDDLSITEQQSNSATHFDLDDEGFPMPHPSFLNNQCDSEPVLDKDGFPEPSVNTSKHEQYVDIVEEIVDVLTTLKSLTERKKIRSFVNRSARQIAILKEQIKMFEELGRIPADGKLQVKEIVSSNNASSQTDSSLMQSDALSENEAQKQFLENTTDETGRSPPQQAVNTMGFTKRMPDMYSSTPQRPNRNAQASTKLSNTGVNFSGVEDDYNPNPNRRGASEFFAFG